VTSTSRILSNKLQFNGTTVGLFYHKYARKGLSPASYSIAAPQFSDAGDYFFISRVIPYPVLLSGEKAGDLLP